MTRAADIRRVLARNIRRLRKAKGLTQSELATDAGQHQYVISKAENGRVDLRLDTIGRIARALGARPRDLFEE